MGLVHSQFVTTRLGWAHPFASLLQAAHCTLGPHTTVGSNTYPRPRLRHRRRNTYAAWFQRDSDVFSPSAVTWDPAFFSSGNTTVVVFGSHRNATNGALSKEDAFASSPIPITKSFYAWSVDREIMQHTPGVNISIGLRTLPVSNSSHAPVRGPDVYVAKALPFRQPPSTPPSGPALYIGLPIIFAFITLMLVGTLVWGKNYRNIGLGNVMSRGRRGGYQKLGSGRSRRSRGDPKESIGLMNIDTEADYANQGRFSIDSDNSTGSDARPARHRRSS